MAAPTDTENALNCRFWLDDATGALREISADATRVGVEATNLVSDDTYTFTNRWPLTKVAGSSVRFNVDLVFRKAAGSGYDIIRDWYTGNGWQVARTFRAEIPASETGADRWQAEAHLSGMPMELNPSEPGPIMISFTLVPTGDVDHDIVGS